MTRVARLFVLMALAACADDPTQSNDTGTSAQDDASLYDWLVGEEVPTSRVIFAMPDADALADSKIQDEPRYKVGITVPVDADIDLGGATPMPGAAPVPVADGAIRFHSDGFVWSAVLESPGATSLRLGFDDFDLPEGVALYLYNDLGQVTGPYTESGANHRGTFFANTLPTDLVHLQLRYDGTDIAATLAEIEFVLSEVAYLDDRFVLGRPPARPGQRTHCTDNAVCVENAECDLNDPAGEAAVADKRDAVGQMLFASGGSWYICTGGLLESLTGTLGYFMTANHCISTAAEAASLQTYWHFTTPCGTTVCDTAWAPDATTNPPAGSGATIVDTNATTDFTLLKLDTDPPVTTKHLPWNHTPIALTAGEKLYRISHPSGSPQAYSAHEVFTGWDNCGGAG
ncbi:MAG: hypothetical protein JRJ84_18410, partial [Deltaproteobacteria bacterium]|nr:hypothetical protein [Deltaproteobacteria bacterium]